MPPKRDPQLMPKKKKALKRPHEQEMTDLATIIEAETILAEQPMTSSQAGWLSSRFMAATKGKKSAPPPKKKGIHVGQLGGGHSARQNAQSTGRLAMLEHSQPANLGIEQPKARFNEPKIPSSQGFGHIGGKIAQTMTAAQLDGKMAIGAIPSQALQQNWHLGGAGQNTGQFGTQNTHPSNQALQQNWHLGGAGQNTGQFGTQNTHPSNQRFEQMAHAIPASQIGQHGAGQMAIACLPSQASLATAVHYFHGQNLAPIQNFIPVQPSQGDEYDWLSEAPESIRASIKQKWLRDKQQFEPDGIGQIEAISPRTLMSSVAWLWAGWSPGNIMTRLIGIVNDDGTVHDTLKGVDVCSVELSFSVPGHILCVYAWNALGRKLATLKAGTVVQFNSVTVMAQSAPTGANVQISNSRRGTFPFRCFYNNSSSMHILQYPPSVMAHFRGGPTISDLSEEVTQPQQPPAHISGNPSSDNPQQPQEFVCVDMDPEEGEEEEDDDKNDDEDEEAEQDVSHRVPEAPPAFDGDNVESGQGGNEEDGDEIQMV